MLKDRYDLPVSTASTAARDAYGEGLDLLLMQYPGVVAAFDRALTADPGFALAHVGRAQMCIIHGDGPGARAALGNASRVAGGITAREAGQLAFFGTMLDRPVGEAITALREHVAQWPRDALVLNTTANPNGLLGASGEVGQKAALAALMNVLAPHYGEDWWFTSAHAMALNENGQRDAARPMIARSLAQRPDSAWIAHSQAHLFYEDGEAEAARTFLGGWLRSYPRGGILYGHLTWHQALSALAAGDAVEAQRLYGQAVSLETHPGFARQKLTDAVSFLWRWELAGHPRDAAGWAALHRFAMAHWPAPGSGFADLHVVLAQSVAEDEAGLSARWARMAEMAADGRYPSGDVVAAISRGFLAYERQDFACVIEVLEPLLALSERIGGSRAQTDLVEFTLLRACVEAGRLADLRRLLAARRPARVTVAGVH